MEIYDPERPNLKIGDVITLADSEILQEVVGEDEEGFTLRSLSKKEAAKYMKNLALNLAKRLNVPV